MATTEQAGMAAIFEVYGQMELAEARLAQAKRDHKDAKEAFDTAKDELKAAQSALAQAKDNVLLTIHGMKGGNAATAERPMGWIDAGTRPGRKFTLAGSDDRVEFRGIEDGAVRMFWADGTLAGESFLPAGDVTVEQWNADYAAKVEGYVDPVAKPPPADDESWRTVRLDSLTLPSIPDKVLKALAEHSPCIETIGDLCDWQKAKSDFWAKDIRNIGPEAAGKIADALEAFWQRRADGGEQ